MTSRTLPALVAALFVLPVAASFVSATAPSVAPGPALGLWWEEFEFDADGDRVDDRLEERVLEAFAAGEPTRLVPVFVDLPRIPTAADALRVEAFGGAKVRPLKNVELIAAHLPADRVESFVASWPELGMLEWAPPYYASLSVSAAAVKAKPSGAFSPNTAWERGYRGEGMVVAVIDTGVRDDHTFFTALANGDPKWLAGADYVNTDTLCTNPPDNGGHGTHVASTAVGNGGVNTYPYGANSGVAPEAQLIELRISDDLAAEAGAIASAMDWMITWNAQIDNGIMPCPGVGADDKVDVVTLSFGSLGNGGDGKTGDAAVVNRVVASGIVMTIAAGNCGAASQGTGTNALCPATFSGPDHTIGSPATADGAITVANYNDQNSVPLGDDAISGSSSRGPRDSDGDSDTYDEQKPEIAAPGENIVAASNTGADTATVSMSGTSMATPHMAGVAALLLQANPNCRPYEKAPVTGTNLWNDKIENPLRDALVATAISKTAGASITGVGKFGRTWSNGWGYGQVDTNAAIDEVLEGTTCPAPPGAPLSARPGGAYGVEVGLPVTLDGRASGGIAPFTFLWATAAPCVFADVTDAGTTLTCSEPGNHEISLTVTDSTSATASATTVVVAGVRQVEFADADGTAAWAVVNVEPEPAPWHAATDGELATWYDGVTVGPAGRYTPQQDTTLVSPPIDLTDAISASLAFSVRGERELGFDFMHVQWREVGGPWFAVDTVSGVFGSRTGQTFDISSAKGKTVQVGFRSFSDDNVEGEGYHLRDFVVEKVAAAPDVLPPSKVTGLVVSNPGDGASLRLAWDPATDDAFVSHYDVYRAEVSGLLGTKAKVGSATGTTLLDGGLVEGTTYHYQVVAVDAAGNAGDASDEASGIPAFFPDTTPPTTPGTPIVTDLRRGDSVRVSWAAASDDRGLVTYEVERDVGSGFAPLATTGVLHAFDGDAPGAVSYRVRAVDAAGNAGAWSATTTGAATADTTEWTQFHRDAGRTAAAGAAADLVAPRLLPIFSTSGAIRSSPLVADVDGDGLQEVVVVSDMTTAADRVRASALRFVDGAWQQVWSYEAPFDGIIDPNTKPTNGEGSAAIGDLDADGDLEVVVYWNYWMNLGGVTANQGNLAVLDAATGAQIDRSDPGQITIGVPAAHPVVGDTDGDGNPEFVVMAQIGGTEPGYYLQLWDLTGDALTRWTDSRFSTRASIASPLMADIDPARPGLEVVMADGSATATAPPDPAGNVYLCRVSAASGDCESGFPVGSGVRGLAAADLDGDGTVEIVVNGRTNGPSLTVVSTVGGVFGRVSLPAGPLYNTAAIGDLDDDGLPEIVTIANNPANGDTDESGDVRVFGYGGGNELVQKAYLARPPPPAGSAQSPGGAVIADLDGDGRQDVLFTGRDQNVRALTLVGGTLEELWSLSVVSVAPPALGDVTGDGLLDLVVGDERGTVVVYTTSTPPANTVPVLGAIGPQAVAEGETLAITLSSTDEDGDTPAYAMTGAPSGATLSGASFSWTPSFTQAGAYDVTFTVSDGEASDSEVVTITVSDVNRAPVLAPIGAKIVDVYSQKRLAFTLSATDADGDALSYSAQNLPAGASFEPSNRTFWWYPSAAQAGVYEGVRFVATDAGGASDLEDVRVTVTANARPGVSVAVVGALQAQTTPGTPVELRFRVTNTGLASASVQLALVNLPASWSASGPTELTLAAGANEVVTVVVTPQASTVEALIGLRASSAGATPRVAYATVRLPIFVDLALDFDTYFLQTPVSGSVEATWLDGSPAAGVPILLSESSTVGGQAVPGSRTLSVTTGADGTATFAFEDDVTGSTMPGDHVVTARQTRVANVGSSDSETYQVL